MYYACTFHVILYMPPEQDNAPSTYISIYVSAARRGYRLFLTAGAAGNHVPFVSGSLEYTLVPTIFANSVSLMCGYISH